MHRDRSSRYLVGERRQHQLHWTFHRTGLRRQRDNHRHQQSEFFHDWLGKNQRSGPGRTSKHVVLVMEENQGYSTVAGNTSAWPHLNALIGAGALATNYYADTHPSIGNYFMLTTGQMVTTDDSSTAVENVDNIARRLLAANVSFKVYAEGITQGYLGGNTGLYVIRHNPFALFSDIANSPSRWPTRFSGRSRSLRPT